jgi:alkylation response protein AidB-like acyl-CoA dehydrogenase
MFEFTQEQDMIRQMVRRWCNEKLAPQVDAIEGGEQPYALMRDFVKTFGIAEMVKGGFKAAEDKRKTASDAGDDGGDGGMAALGGGDPAMAAILSMEMSRICPGFMLAMGASMGLAGGAIMNKGTWEQKKKWGIPVLTFEKIGAWGMTEPGAGSDAFRSMRTVAKPVEGGYSISGSKTFITNAPFADTHVVYAKIDHGDGTPLADRPIQAFIVEKGTEGLEQPAPMKKMGMHASPTGELFLQDVFVPADQLLGEKEKSTGRSGGKDVFHSERTGMAPMCAGIIERCLEVSTEYSKERVTWGKPIAEYQLVQEKLARMYMHLENVKNLMFKQLWMVKHKKRMNPAEASSCKLYCARAATECALEAIQILGGNGYMQEYRVEMLMRDAKLLQIGGGTDEIQIINIARHLLAA